MAEIWKHIEGYSNYSISNMGRIKNLKTNKFLKPVDSGNGYVRVALYSNGEKQLVSVHRLVALTFIPNPKNLSQVNHKDENKSNNTVDNLEWCTAKYNSNYGTKIIRVVDTKKKTGSIDRFIEKVSKAIKCIETEEIYPSIKIASEITGLNRAGLSRACNGIYKTCGGYRWSFCEEVLSNVS